MYIIYFYINVFYVSTYTGTQHAKTSKVKISLYMGQKYTKNYKMKLNLLKIKSIKN